MLKQFDSTAHRVSTRRQVSLSLPAAVEAHLKLMAKQGYRSWSREIEMRLTQSYEWDIKNDAIAAEV